MEKKLRGDLKEAILNQLEKEKMTLSLLINEIDKEKKETKVDNLDNDSVIKIISKEVKKRFQSIEAFEKGNRMDLAQKEKDELSVLEGYLPKAPTHSELVAIAKEIKANEPGIHEGKLFGMVNKAAKGLSKPEYVKKAIAES